MPSLDWHTRFTQQARWTAPLRRYLLDQAHLPPGARLLEVGCGTGAVLSALAGELPQLAEDLPLPTGRQAQPNPPRLYGLDLAPDFLRQAARYAPSTRLAQGDALRLPYPSGCFDLVYCHYLLLWLADPAAALIEMRRVVRPGGLVCALAEPDYAGRVDYPAPLAGLGQAQRQALRQQGADPELGRKLAGLFAQAGLEPVERGVLGGQWRTTPTLNEQAGEWAVIENDLAEVLPPAELARLRKLDAAAWRTGQRTLFVPTFYALARI